MAAKYAHPTVELDAGNRHEALTRLLECRLGRGFCPPPRARRQGVEFSGMANDDASLVSRVLSLQQALRAVRNNTLVRGIQVGCKTDWIRFETVICETSCVRSPRRTTASVSSSRHPHSAKIRSHGASQHRRVDLSVLTFAPGMPEPGSIA